jgi:hypothetical protein
MSALHNFGLAILGIHAARNRWAFMLTIAPMPIAKGTGSPVIPITML